MKAPFIWDKYSDQPYPIKDKAYKKQKRRENLWDYIPLLLTNIIFFPLSILLMKFFKAQPIDPAEFYGMGVDLDKGDPQIALIQELGVKHILIRMPLWEMKRVDEYLDFAKKFKDQTILLNILQDREHIENKKLLQKDITTIFEKFSPIVSEYQIGNAINRTKWGFFSMSEYLSWYQTIQEIRDRDYPTIQLIGSSIIDFEYHYTIRTLFNNYPIKYDKFSSLLYVDRRGSPSNTQMGIFDTKNKIDMLYSLVKLSPKTTNDIYITEVNWPLSNTAPYAPTSERECISEEEYSNFMIEYLKTAKQSGKIKRVYWHQLIARGYGLVDDGDKNLRKMEAFYRFEELTQS